MFSILALELSCLIKRRKKCILWKLSSEQKVAVPISPPFSSSSYVRIYVVVVTYLSSSLHALNGLAFYDSEWILSRELSYPVCLSVCLFVCFFCVHNFSGGRKKRKSNKSTDTRPPKRDKVSPIYPTKQNQSITFGAGNETRFFLIIDRARARAHACNNVV